MLGSELWAHWVGAKRSPGLPRLVWSPLPSEAEQLFWEPLLERAASLLTSLRVIDCGSPPLPPSRHDNVCVEHIDVTQYSIPEAHRLGAQLRESCQNGGEVWIRLAGPVHEPLTTLGRCGLPALVLVPLHAETTEFWRTQGELLAKTVVAPEGVVGIGEVPWREWK